MPNGAGGNAGLAARHVWLPAYYYTETGHTDGSNNTN